MTSNYHLSMETRQQIQKIGHFHRKFKLTCKQLVHISNLLTETHVHYKHSKQENHCSYRYVLHLKLWTLQAVFIMFTEYTHQIGNRLIVIRKDLYHESGIRWNHRLALQLETGTSNPSEDADDEPPNVAEEVVENGIHVA